MLRSISFACLCAVVLAGCGGGGDSGPTGNNGNDNAPIAITIAQSASLSLTSGASQTLSATATARDGHIISGAAITWTSSDQTIVAVSGSTITAIKAGTATITATSGSATASITVIVSPGAVSQLAIRTQPGGAAIGSPLGTQPVLEFHDAAGNLVTSSGAFVTATIASGGGSLSGGTIAQATGGVVTFTNLAVLGTSGPRTLAFTAGTLTVTSASFTVTPPPTPFIVADNAAVTFSLQGIGDSAKRTINITNAGTQPLNGMTTSIVYDAGIALGWLSAQLSEADAPAVLTLTATANNLAGGAYHATVKITGPGASNSPLSIGVTLTVTPQYTMSYGTSTEKVKVVDIGNAFTPTSSITDHNGAPVTSVAITYASRATTVATVAADGRITAVGGGDTWVVATTPSSLDSLFVIVPRSATAPIIRTDATNSIARVGDTLFVNVLFDTRGTPVGAASIAAQLTLQSGSLNYFYAVPSGTPTPVVNAEPNGFFRISVGAATGITGTVQLLQLKVVGRSTNTIGWLNLYALDVSAVDGSSLTTQTTATRLPLVIR